MNSEVFVDAVKRHVMASAIDGLKSTIAYPPGRGAPPHDIERSSWYRGLSEAELGFVNSVIAEAVHSAIFGLFAAFDGSRKIDDEGGRYEVAYVSDTKVILNDPLEIGLHEILGNTEQST